jgi:hypothetical protein
MHAAYQGLWSGCCGPDVVARMLRSGCCGPDVVARMLWPGCCGPDVVVRILWPGCCGPDVVVLSVIGKLAVRFILIIKNVSEKFVEKIKTHFEFNKLFINNRIVYEIIWKNIVDPSMSCCFVWVCNLVADNDGRM